MSTSYQICWNKFQKNISEYLQSMLAKDFLTDVSLYSGNQTWKVHRVVLCANSGYFEQLLRGLAVQQHPVLVLDHIHPEFISYLLEYIYTGNINIEQGKVEQFIQVSKQLQIRGITDYPQTRDNNGQSVSDTEDLEPLQDNQQHFPSNNHGYKSNETLHEKSKKRKRLPSERSVLKKSTNNAKHEQQHEMAESRDYSEMAGNISPVLNDGTEALEAPPLSEVKTEPFVEVGLLPETVTNTHGDQRTDFEHVDIKPEPEVGDEGGGRIQGEGEGRRRQGEGEETRTLNNQEITRSQQISRWHSDLQKGNKRKQQTDKSIHPSTQSTNSTPQGSLSVRSDLLPPPSGSSALRSGKSTADLDRCHFCSVHCGSQEALTAHLKSAHMPPKHALCDNCENFFHVCAIVRHRAKCQIVYQADA